MSVPVSIPRARTTALLWLGPLFFISGAIGLIYEVAWFRLLHLVLGVSVFAIGAVVSAFMLGLGFGSAWAGGRMGALGRPLLSPSDLVRESGSNRAREGLSTPR
jgi:hypothetical protein